MQSPGVGGTLCRGLGTGEGGVTPTRVPRPGTHGPAAPSKRGLGLHSPPKLQFTQFWGCLLGIWGGERWGGSVFGALLAINYFPPWRWLTCGGGDSSGVNPPISRLAFGCCFWGGGEAVLGGEEEGAPQCRGPSGITVPVSSGVTAARGSGFASRSERLRVTLRVGLGGRGLKSR